MTKDEPNDIFEHRHYKLMKFCLTLLGEWPFTRTNAKYVNRFVLMFLLLHGIPLMMWAGYDIWKVSKLEATMLIYSPLATGLGSIIKFTCNIYKQDELRRLLLFVNKDWKVSGDKMLRDLTNEYSEKGRRLLILHSCYIVGSGILYALSAFLPNILNVILPLNESRPHRLHFPVKYPFKTTDELYLLGIIQCTAAISVCIVIIVCSDCAYFGLINYACIMFAKSRFHLEHFAAKVDHLGNSDVINFINYDFKSSRLSHEKWLERVYTKRITVGILEHNKALEFAAQLDSCYRLNFLMMVAVNTTAISLSGLQAITRHDAEALMMSVISTIAQTWHIFFLNLSGQLLIDASFPVRDAIYVSEWYAIPTKVQKLLVNVLTRSMKPCEMTAGKFMIMKVETFSVIIQSAMSYLTVLSSFQ